MSNQWYNFNEETDLPYIFGLDNNQSMIKIPQESFVVHKDALDGFSFFLDEIRNAGFQYKIISTLRTFEHQKKIWEAKVLGDRPIMDKQGSKPIQNVQELTPNEVLWSILRYSALPGLSRHHWGSEMDIVAVKENAIMPKKIELTPAEFAPDGPFYDFSLFLRDFTSSQIGHQFFRPYITPLRPAYLGPEPWHISYRPLSEEIYRNFRYDYAQDFLLSKIKEGTLLADEIAKELHRIYRYCFLLGS